MADPADPQPEPADRHHLDRVLRLRSGEEVVATDGRGRWSRCRYAGGGVLEPDGPVVSEPAPSPALTVAFAPVKGERAEWVVQKLTELAVDRIVVLAADRSVVRWEGDRVPAALERLRRVSVGAANQSRRVWLPEVAGVVALAELVADGSRQPALAEPGAPPLTASTTAVAVGPEGGWSPSELASAPALVGLGQQVLRAETAAVAAGVLLAWHRAGTV